MHRYMQVSSFLLWYISKCICVFPLTVTLYQLCTLLKADILCLDSKKINKI